MVVLEREQVEALRLRYARCEANELGSVTAEWSRLSARDIRSAAALVAYHDLLLFILAFPRHQDHPARAGQELHRVAALAAGMSARNASLRFALGNSGVAGTRSFAYYSIDLTRWLIELPGSGHVLDTLDGDEAAVRNVLLATSSGAERDALDDTRTEVIDRLDKGNPLRDLVHRIDRISTSPDVRNALWEACLPNIVSQAIAPVLTRTWCRGIGVRHALFADGYRAGVDVARVCATALRPALKLSAQQREQLVQAARGILIGHLRETDTATLCDPAAVELHDMGHGIHVALLRLPPGRRTSFDDYVGYVAFANSVPVAYGGAWVFPGKSKVGLNVFPAFRGGPSMLLFASILRCYAQRFHIGCFEADNYQLGHGNADGIRTGAYWFYHRCGFRTVDPALAIIASEEHARMLKDRAYRTPPAALRRLVAQPMRLVLHEEAAPLIEPVDLSEVVIGHVSMLEGDHEQRLERCRRTVRAALGVEAMRTWPVEEAHAFNDLAPAVAIVPDLTEWPSRDKRALVSLMRARGHTNGSEYIDRLRSHERVLRAWAALTAGEET